MIRKIAFCLWLMIFSSTVFASSIDHIEDYFTYKGQWSEDKTYEVNDVTHLDGSIFVKVLDLHPRGDPPYASSNWYIIVAHNDYEMIVYMPFDRGEWSSARLEKNGKNNIDWLKLLVVLGVTVVLVLAAMSAIGNTVK